MPITLPTPFSGLIFDCDGTLVDTAPAHYHAIAQALATQGHRMDRDWYFARTGLTPDALLDAQESAAADFGNPTAPLDRAAVFGTYNQHFQSGIHLLQEVEAVASLARQWHGRVPLAVASNGRLPNVQASLRTVGLLPLFDTIVSADDVAHGKPAPDCFLMAAEKLGVRPEDCLVWEDAPAGIAAAKAAGMACIVIGATHTHPIETDNPVIPGYDALEVLVEPGQGLRLAVVA
jgi:beta-phosphoglucomutase-like phosphatase (HAD superfamily)